MKEIRGFVHDYRLVTSAVESHGIPLLTVSLRALPSPTETADGMIYADYPSLDIYADRSGEILEVTYTGGPDEHLILKPMSYGNRVCRCCGRPPISIGDNEFLDGCSGFLKGVDYACCGHGIREYAYAVFNDGQELREDEALDYFRSLGMPVPEPKTGGIEEELLDCGVTSAEEELLLDIIGRYLTLTPVETGYEYVIRYENV